MSSTTNSLHTKITEEIRNETDQIDILLPSQYGRLYAQKAEALKLELSGSELLASELVNEKIVVYIVELGKCSKEALEAMLANDATKLAQAIERTKKLDNELQELRKTVYVDPLTNVYNRKWFKENMVEHSGFIKLRGNGTLVFIDLNDFKSINDTYGHLVGDKALISISTLLQKMDCRVVRYSGDEFILIFDSKYKEEEIEKFLEKLLFSLEKVHFKTGEHNFKISFAYGISKFREGDNVNAVIDKADKAMYRYKEKQSCNVNY